MLIQYESPRDSGLFVSMGVLCIRSKKSHASQIFLRIGLASLGLLTPHAKYSAKIPALK